jgi:toxin ParE1/3/4
VNYKVVWSIFASAELAEIHSYYNSIATKVIADRIVLDILKIAIYLKSDPYLGPIEPLLKDKQIEYRYLVKGNYKIIYSFDEENQQIRILDIFDTRQNPIKIFRNKL